MSNVWVKQRGGRRRRGWSDKHIQSPIIIPLTNLASAGKFIHAKSELEPAAHKIYDLLNEKSFTSIYAVGLGNFLQSYQSLMQLALASNLRELWSDARLYVIEPNLNEEAEEYLVKMDVERLSSGSVITDNTEVSPHSLNKWLNYWNEITIDHQIKGGSSSLILGFHCPPVLSLGISILAAVSEKVTAFNNSPSAYISSRVGKSSVVRVCDILENHLIEIELDLENSSIADAFANMTIQYEQKSSTAESAEASSLISEYLAIDSSIDSMSQEELQGESQDQLVDERQLQPQLLDEPQLDSDESS